MIEILILFEDDILVIYILMIEREYLQNIFYHDIIDQVLDLVYEI